VNQSSVEIPRSVTVGKAEKTVFVTLAQVRGFAIADILFKGRKFPRPFTIIPRILPLRTGLGAPNAKEVRVTGVTDEARRKVHFGVIRTRY